MNVLTSRVLATATVVTMLGTCGSALAAEAPAPIEPAASTISVQLDGKNLTFTDAMPQVKDSRTFLPFRTVFEAMGAEVSYDAATNQVSATRGNTKVVMTLGSTDATLTKDGVDATLTMDVVPYAADNRTYVPVRFAAQAFGCAVGWDQDDQTVILVDTEELLRSAQDQYKFTRLEQFQAYSAQFEQGIWDMDATFDGAFSSMDAASLTFEGTVDATMESPNMDMEMAMKMDMQAFLKDLAELAQQPNDFSSDDLALLNSMKEDGVELKMRSDLTSNMYYINMSGPALESLGMPADTWYSVDLSEMGVDYAALLEASQSLDLSGLLQSVFTEDVVDDKDTAYETMYTMVNQVAKALSDESFVKDGDSYTNTYRLDEDGDYLEISLTLDTEKDQVVGYSMDVNGTAAIDETTSSVISLSSDIDEKNHMTATFTVSIPELAEMSMNLTGDYVKGDKAPQTEPPADAVVVPLY